MIARALASAGGAAHRLAAPVLVVLRPLNLIGIGVGVLVSLRLGGVDGSAAGTDAATVAAWMLVAGGGYALDAYHDAEVDARFHPARSVGVRRPVVLLLGLGLIAAGVIASAFGHGRLWALVVPVAVMLLAYGPWLKRVSGACGNLAVSVAMAAAALSGALADGRWPGPAALAAAVFLTNLARELVMDIEDMEADRWARARTLPLAHGLTCTRLVAMACLAAAAACSYLLVLAVGRPLVLTVALTVANVALIGDSVRRLAAWRGDTTAIIAALKLWMIACVGATAASLG